MTFTVRCQGGTIVGRSTRGASPRRERSTRRTTRASSSHIESTSSRFVNLGIISSALILLLTCNCHFLVDTSISHMPGNFDAHAVYAGDDAVSSHGRWSQLATAGVRNALSALISYHGLDNVYNPTTSTSAVGRLPMSNKPPGQPNPAQNIFLPSTSSQQSTFSS